MKKIKLGVMGAMRGSSCMKFCLDTDMMELVAICDKNEEVLKTAKESLGDGIAYYKDFDSFIEHDMDAVVLANYAHQHAPFAIRAMQKGKHVFSEVLPCQTMKEAVELIEAVEKYGKIYAYGENYCYMRAPYEMRRLYREGRIGEFEYGEGEYIHNCEDWWASLTYGEPDHWRNNMYCTFYCTHSLGPIVHITGLRPVSVLGIESNKNARNLGVGAKSAQFGIEMVTFENGAVAKSFHGGLYKNSVWFSLYGSQGRMETAREDAQNGGVNRIFINSDEYPGGYGTEKTDNYLIERNIAGSSGQGHGGGDDMSLYNFAKAIFGDDDADYIDVYEAMLRGEYVLRADDLLKLTKFPDRIALGNYAIDIHNPSGSGTTYHDFKAGEYYSVPYRSLVPKEYDNMLVAGRCLSADHDAQSAVRIMPTVAAMGEAAGTAIAVAIDGKSTVSKVDISKVQDILRKNGAVID